MPIGSLEPDLPRSLPNGPKVAIRRPERHKGSELGNPDFLTIRFRRQCLVCRADLVRLNPAFDALRLKPPASPRTPIVIRPAPLAALLAFAFTVPSFGQAVKPKDDALGAPVPEGGTALLGPDLSKWVVKNGDKPATWPLQDGIMTVKGGDIMTKDKYGDFKLHVEFNIPYMPDKKGQARGNSGVYLGGIYELQVLDSYGLKLQDNDCGAIYKQIIPSVNACKPPLQWQTYDVMFHAAKVKDGKTRKARLTVVHNGHTIIDDKEISPTPGGVGGINEGDKGPISLQDHGNAVQYRNIWIKPLD